MSRPVIPIKPIDFDSAKRHVDEVALERKIPMQVMAQPQPISGSIGGGEGPSEKAPRDPARTPTRNFTVDLPDYVIDAINQRAYSAKPPQTKRFVVLQMCQSYGIDVKPADLMPDGRRRLK